MKKKYKIVMLIALFIIACLRLDNYNYSIKKDIKAKENTFSLKGLKTNLDWELDSPLIILNNFSDTESHYDFCSGSGTKEDPYLIENLTINANEINCCIYIKDTKDYFEFRNITLLNANVDLDYAFVYCFNVSNGYFEGIKTDEDVSVYNGIVIKYANNITINKTRIGDTYVMGSGLSVSYSNDTNIISSNFSKSYLSRCINLTIRGSIFETSGGYYNSLYLYHCNYTLIDNSTFIGGNSMSFSYCNFAIVNTSIFKESSSCVRISFSYNISLYNNDMNSDYVTVVYISHVVNITLENNKIHDILGSGTYGIEMDNVNNSLFQNNEFYNLEYGIEIDNSFNSSFIHNYFHGIHLFLIDIKITSSNITFYYNNFTDENFISIRDNSIFSNYSHNYYSDYTGSDGDDNGIGDIPYVYWSMDWADYFPLWNDGIDYPDISLVLSTYDYEETPPDFVFTVFSVNLNKTWYVLSGGGFTSHNTFFTDNGTIDSVIWLSFNSGLINITFFANDSNGDENSISIVIEIPEEEEEENKKLESELAIEPLDLSQIILYLLIGVVVIGVSYNVIRYLQKHNFYLKRKKKRKIPSSRRK